jgi:hypothetical protein
MMAQTAASASASPPIKFEVPAVVDPIHTNGEPDIIVEPLGRVFVSGPTGTGTQRSVWLGSVDRGHTFRIINPGVPPTALASTNAPPGGGDTDIAFDRSGKQYFADLYALICLRTATLSLPGFPHVITYPEPGSAPGFTGSMETGSIACPTVPSSNNPCSLTVKVNVAGPKGQRSGICVARQGVRGALQPASFFECVAGSRQPAVRPAVHRGEAAGRLARMNRGQAP